MKRFLFIALVAIASCTKQDVATLAPQNRTIEPSIDSVKWRAVYAGSNASTEFTVHLTADSNLVESVKLFIVPTALRWEVKKPQTGKYIMYDHIGDGPEGNYYYFVFYNKDGTTKTLSSFQVY